MLVEIHGSQSTFAEPFSDVVAIRDYSADQIARVTLGPEGGTVVGAELNVVLPPLAESGANLHVVV